MTDNDFGRSRKVKTKGGRTIQYKITIDLETQRHLTPEKAQLLRECICDAVAFFGICFGVEFFVQRDL